MADEPNTPSTEASVADAPASEPSSEPQAESSRETPSWWQRITRRQPVAREPEPEAEDSSEAEGASGKLVLSQEELDRRVQAETDRREAKRMAEVRARQRKELRDKDPWAYAEEERKAEQEYESNTHVQSFLQGLSGQHDRVTIDPLMERLPDSERERILKMEGAGAGIQGRKLLVTEAMKALEKHWKAEGAKDAERKLRSNPAFRKQVLSEIRGGAVEPDLLPAYGSSASAADQTVSALLRRHYDLPAPRDHNEMNGR